MNRLKVWFRYAAKHFCVGTLFTILGVGFGVYWQFTSDERAEQRRQQSEKAEIAAHQKRIDTIRAMDQEHDPDTAARLAIEHAKRVNLMPKHEQKAWEKAAKEYHANKTISWFI